MGECMRAQLGLAIIALAALPLGGCYTPTDITAETAPSASYRGSPITRDVRALRHPLDLRDARQAYDRLRQATLDPADPTRGSATLAACAEAIRPLEGKPPQALSPEERTQLMNIRALLLDVGSPDALLLVSGAGRPRRSVEQHAADLRSLAVYVDWAAWRIDPESARKAARAQWLTEDQLSDLAGIAARLADMLGPDLLASVKPSGSRPLRAVVGPVLIVPAQRQGRSRVGGRTNEAGMPADLLAKAAMRVRDELDSAFGALPGVITLNAAEQAAALAALHVQPSGDVPRVGEAPSAPAPATHRLIATAHPDVVVLDLLDMRTGHLAWSGVAPIAGSALRVVPTAGSEPGLAPAPDDGERVAVGARRAADTIASIALDAQRQAADAIGATSLQAALASSAHLPRPRVRLNRFRAPPQLQDLADALYHRLKSALARRFDVVVLDAEGQGYVVEALQNARAADDEPVGTGFTRAFGPDDLGRERMKADYVVFGAFEGRWAGRRCTGGVELVLGDAGTGTRIGSALWAVPGSVATVD